MLNEFTLIQRYFNHKPMRADVNLSVGDDCALLSVPAGQWLAVSIDTLTEGVHFLSSMPARALGHKALAVSLSDLAAMGAKPAWATLAITLPEIDETWLAEFSAGFFSLAKEYEVDLVGGNISKGPRSVSVQAHGFVPPGQALRRDAAKIGDLIYVSGYLGASGAAVQVATKSIAASTSQIKMLNENWYYPQPQIELGLALRNVAHAAIDLSDGLLGDLQHVLDASQVGAEIWLDKIPLHPLLLDFFSLEQSFDLALTAGEDYQLCFTVPENKANELSANRSLTCIGKIIKETTMQMIDHEGRIHFPHQLGYQHF